MISIDRFEEILSDLAEEIPQSFYEELNGGIVVEPGYLLHPEDRNGTLYVMGQYRIDPAMGKYIVMYYGSFKRAYRHLDEDELTEEMRKVLRHEFRHHVEGRAGVRDLEVWDAEQIAMYKEQQADNDRNHRTKPVVRVVRLLRNYSFADKQERTADRSKVVRKFLPMVETLFLQKCKKPDTCSGFLRICTANSISCALPRGSVSIAKTDFIDRLNHPNEIYRSGGF